LVNAWLVNDPPPKADVIVVLGGGLESRTRAGRLALARGASLPPFGGGHGKALLEAAVKNRQATVAAFNRRVDYLELRVAQQGAGLFEAQLGHQGTEVAPAEFVKQAARVAFAAAQMFGQLRQAQIRQFRFGHRQAEHLFPSLLRWPTPR